jgi:hypothetical protein
VQLTNIAPGGSLTSPEVALSVLADSDHDGMADAWEKSNGLDPANPADAVQDPDQDGFTNLDEYRAGTDPRSANSVLRIESMAASGNQVTIGFTAVSNRTYSVLYRDSADPGEWVKLQDVFNRPTNRLESLSDPVRTNGVRYYRLVTPRQ